MFSFSQCSSLPKAANSILQSNQQLQVPKLITGNAALSCPAAPSAQQAPTASSSASTLFSLMIKFRVTLFSQKFLLIAHCRLVVIQVCLIIIIHCVHYVSQGIILNGSKLQMHIVLYPLKTTTSYLHYKTYPHFWKLPVFLLKLSVLCF